MKVNNNILVGILIVTVAVLFLVIVVNETSGETIIVAQDGNGDYDKIQGAIDNADEGDTIRVWEGTYYEHILVNKTVSLEGNGSEETTIDGAERDNVVSITSNWANFNGFRVRGSQGPFAGIYIESNNNNIFNNNCSNYYTGIYLLDSSNCTITNNTCEKNDNLGIYLRDSKDCTIENNFCLLNRFGIYIVSSSHCKITNNTCLSNSEDGIGVWYSDYNTIKNNNFSLNNGDGIHLYESSKCTIMNNICWNNFYGIFLDDSQNTTISNNSCSKNTCGIDLRYSNGCQIVNNNCSLNNGYGIGLRGHIFGGPIRHCDYNTISFNTVWKNDEGIWLCYSKNCTLTNNTITENRIGVFLMSSSRDNIAHHNNIYNNTEYGIDALVNSGETINATNNWWGDISGPYHPTKNPIGMGDNITDYVTFNKRPIAFIESITPNPALNTDTVTFMAPQLDCRCGEDYIICYVWSSSIDGELYNNSADRFTYAGLSNGSHTIFLKVMDKYGFWSDEVSATLIVLGVPHAEILEISPNPATDTESVTFIGMGTDDGSVERYVWRTEDRELYNGTSSTFIMSNLSSGNHTIIFRVQDNNGIWSQDVNSIITIVVTPNRLPILTITSQKNGTRVSGILTINVTAYDEDGNITKIEYYSELLGYWLYLTDLESHEYTVDTKEMKNGEITFRYRCYDGLNYSEEASITLNVKNNEDSSGGGFLPGFEAMAVVWTIGVTMILCKKRGKKEMV